MSTDWAWLDEIGQDAKTGKTIAQDLWKKTKNDNFLGYEKACDDSLRLVLCIKEMKASLNFVATSDGSTPVLNALEARETLIYCAKGEF